MLTLGQRMKFKTLISSHKLNPGGSSFPKISFDDVSLLYNEQTGNTLRNSGRAWVGKCPFHEDDRPSFAIYPETQSAYCFGCNWNGKFSWLVKCLKEI